jgi:hypothetical protein
VNGVDRPGRTPFSAALGGFSTCVVAASSVDLRGTPSIQSWYTGANPEGLMDAPIPTPRSDDDEDVHWALSTAGALWGRGERVEALKWLRRAAEQASDVNADMRSLELFKAAAELASSIGPTSIAPAAPKPHPLPLAAPPAAPTPLPPEAVVARAAPPPHAPPKPPPPSPPSAQPAPAPVSKAPPAPPPRPSSAYPPPPAVASSVRTPVPPPPAVPASAPVSAMPPRPALHAGAPAPPVPSASRTPAPPSARPAPPFQPPPPPPIPKAAPLAPARTVAITTAEPKAAPVAAPAAPRRRRSFTGEARASADKARPAEPGRTHRTEGPRARRRTFDDEPTRQQSAVPTSEPARRPAPAEHGEEASRAPAAPEGSSIFDDLDEDTRVLQHRPGGVVDVIDQAFERLQGLAPSSMPVRLQQAPEAAPPPAEPRSQMRTALGLSPHGELAGPGGRGGGPTVAAAQARVDARASELQGAPTEPAAPEPTTWRATPTPSAVDGDHALRTNEPREPGDDGAPFDDVTGSSAPRRAPAPPPSQPTGIWTPPPDMESQGPVTERPSTARDARQPHAAAAGAASMKATRTRAAAPPRHVDAVPSVRVAVLATTTPGEVRLIALNAGDDAPPGAAIALLVPFTSADGESVLKLFRGGE